MPFTIESAKAWLASGRAECSPLQASGLMHSAPYNLNKAAEYWQEHGVNTIGGVRFRFAGRNLRLMVADILKTLEV